MGILDDIKSNSLEELHMSNLPEDYFETPDEFAEAMKDNTSITSVIFDGDFLVCLHAKDRAIVVSCLGKLPNLESVVLKDSRLLIGVCMTNLVKDAPKLKALSMINCTLQGTPADFDTFTNALMHLEGTFQNLVIQESFAPNEDVQLDQVMTGLKELAKIDVTCSS